MLFNSLLWIYFRKRGDAYVLAVKHSLGGLNDAWCCTGLCTLLTGAAVSSTLISAASLPVTRCSDAVCTGIGITRCRAMGQLLLSLAGSGDACCLAEIKVFSQFGFFPAKLSGKALGRELLHRREEQNPSVRSGSREETLAGDGELEPVEMMWGQGVLKPSSGTWKENEEKQRPKITSKERLSCKRNKPT